MKRSHLLTVWALLGGPLLTVGVSTAQLQCPPMPDKITQVNRDVRSEVEANVGSLGKLKAGQVGVKTEVVAKNLFDKYPNTDRIAVVQMMAATYCSMIRDSKTLKDSEKLRLWEEFSERVFKFENPSYNPPLPTTSKSKGSLPGAGKGADAHAEPRKSEESSTAKEKPAQAVLQNPAAHHWFTKSTTSPPESIEFRSSGVSIPLTLVTGSHFGDEFPMAVAPYYLSTAYLPKQLFREYAMNNAVRAAVPPSSEDKEPVCEVYLSDAVGMAENFGFQLPTAVQWINAFEGKFIDPQGKVELIYGKDEGNKESLAEARTDEGRGNTYLSSKVTLYNFLSLEKAKGCLRITISLDELRKIGFLKTQ